MTTATRTHVPERLEVLSAKSHFWANAMSIENDRLRLTQRRLGYPVVAITAATSVAAFVELQDNPAWWAKLTVALAALAAAILAAIQTRGDYAVRSTKAAGLSDQYGQLYGKMLDVIDGRSDTKPEDLYERYTALRADRPEVSEHVREAARKTVAADLDAQKAHQELIGHR